MRTPVVKRQTSPESGFCQFFPLCFRSSVVRLWQRVPSSFPLLVRQRGCTTHVLRVSHHRDGGYRECEHGSLRPRNFAVPSYRPTQRRGCTSACASEAQGRGRGSTRSPSGTFAIWSGASAGVQSHAQGQGTVPMCSCAFVDARTTALQSTMARLAHRDPGRPRARLLPSLHAGERCRERIPRRVST